MVEMLFGDDAMFVITSLIWIVAVWALVQARRAVALMRTQLRLNDTFLMSISSLRMLLLLQRSTGAMSDEMEQRVRMHMDVLEEYLVKRRSEVERAA